MNISELVRELINAGTDPALAADVVARAAIAGATISPNTKTARQERNARYYSKVSSEKRLNKTNSDGQDVSDETLPSPKEKSPPAPPLKKLPLPTQPSASPQDISRRERDFDRFWQVYPHKMGKADAVRAFPKAFAKYPGLTVEILIEGIQRYIRFKPPDIDYCHPATWLNGGRWNDEWTQRNGGNPQRQHRPASGHDNLLALVDELHGPGGRGGQRTADHAGETDAYRDTAGVYRLTN